jgi:uncharacterized protein (TIGR03437 family)
MSGQTPLISAGGVVNAASYSQPAVLAPGVIFAVLGTSLSDGTIAAAAPGASSLPTLLAGARMLVNGVAAPLFYVSPGVINAQFPVELTGITTASVQVEVQSASGTVTSPAITVTVAPYSPGIFTIDQNGIGPGLIYRASDSSRICPPGRSDCAANPAVPGEVVSFYMTGLGAVNGSWVSGQAAQSASSTVTTPSVTVGGAQAQVLFSGLSELSVGLYQVDVILPATLAAGDSVPLSVSIGGTASNQVTISIGTAGALTQDAGPLEAGAVTAIAIDPVHRYTLYAGTGSSGVFKSINGGQSWTAVNNGLPIAPVSVLVIDPSNPAVVYAGIHESGPNDGAYKSTDGGASWTPIRNGLTRGVADLVIDPENPNVLYASTLGAGVFKSIDGGGSWIAVGQPGNALAIDPITSATIYTGNSQGVYKSTDGAASWTLSAVLGGANVSVLVIDPLNPATLYAGASNNGVFKSTDAGASWSAAGLPGGSVNALALDPLNPANLYAGTNNGGVFKSTDGAVRLPPRLTQTVKTQLTVR